MRSVTTAERFFRLDPRSTPARNTAPPLLPTAEAIAIAAGRLWHKAVAPAN